MSRPRTGDVSSRLAVGAVEVEEVEDNTVRWMSGGAEGKVVSLAVRNLVVWVGLGEDCPCLRAFLQFNQYITIAQTGDDDIETNGQT